jgi:hypothetical protein
MSYRVKAFVAIAIFYGIQLALNHCANPTIQRFMTHYWFLRRHWYSPFLLSSLFFYLAIFFYVRHHQKRLMASKVS